MITKIGTDINYAKQLLEGGELTAIPTETVYGLAGNALNEDAVIKIFTAKNRPSFNPLIIHVAKWEQVESYVNNIPAKAKLLAKEFIPGPITFLLDKKNNVPDIVTAGSSKVAIRIPNHLLTLALLNSLPFPLAAPSANPFGYISPTTAQHVYDSLNGKLSYILDGGAASVGVESTIIGFNENENILLYRSGGIAKQQIEDVVGEEVLLPDNTIASNPETPGRLASHYAPKAALYIGNIDELKNKYPDKKIISISFTKKYEGIYKQFVLSPIGNINEAAKNLFAVLREVDALQPDVILAEYVPNQGIGIAINDRLKRASAENKK